MARSFIDARPDDVGDFATLLQAYAKDIAFLQVLGAGFKRQDLSHVFGFVVVVARFDECGCHRLCLADGDDIVNELDGILAARHRRTDRNVFGDHPGIDLRVDIESRIDRRKTLRIDIMQNGDLEGSVSQNGAVGAHRLFRLVGGHRGGIGIGGAPNRVVSGFQANLGINFSAVDNARGDFLGRL